MISLISTDWRPWIIGAGAALILAGAIVALLASLNVDLTSDEDDDWIDPPLTAEQKAMVDQHLAEMRRRFIEEEKAARAQRASRQQEKKPNG